MLNSDTDLNAYDLSGGDTTLVNTARVVADDPQGLQVNDEDTGIVELNLPKGAVLLNKIATAGQIVPGAQITYVLTVENIGEQDLFPLLVSEPDLFDQGLTFVGSEAHDDVFAAVDLVSDKLRSQITRHKEKFRNRKHPD